VTLAEQLRLILLGAGAALIGGLWWWGRRRGQGPVRDDAPKPAVPNRFEPRMGESATDPEPTIELPPLRNEREDRPVPHGDPPVLTIDGLPEDPGQVMLARDSAPFVSGSRRVQLSPIAEPRTVPVVREVHPAYADRRAHLASVGAVPPAPLRASGRREPDDKPAFDDTEPDAAAGAAVPQPGRVEPDTGAPPVLTTTKPPPPEPPPTRQRIVAIRLVAPTEQRLEGGELRSALEGEGLEFGRYSIFHRLRADGRVLYSVASLVEPGSFDIASMDTMSFPGVSLFAVFPGPMPAPQAFDELLSTARRLGDRLRASLQDDVGSSLTGQRVLSIREELVHFEHLVSMTRARSQT
jgi:cell division protein ZipA